MAQRLIVALLLATGCSSQAAKVTRNSQSSEQGAKREAINGEKLRNAIAEQRAIDALTLAAAVERQGEEITDDVLFALLQLVDEVPAQLLPTLPASLSASVVDLRKARVAHHVGDVPAAVAHLDRAGNHERLRVQIDEVELLLRAKTTVVDPRQIAVLLPISGDHVAVGEEIWTGIESASIAHPGASLKVFDTQGTEEGARAAVLRAAQQGSLLVIGPVGRFESRAAAKEAALQQIPIVLLAPDSSSPNASEGVFGFTLAPEFEAEQAAIVAVELGYELLAVMAPRDELGRIQSKAFIDAATNLGADVVRVGDYDPSMMSIEVDFRRFLNLDPRTNKRLRNHFRQYGRRSWKSFSPDIEFDLLYMPDRTNRVALAASYLPFYNVELQNQEAMGIYELRRKHGGRMPRVVQLMGSQAWLGQGLSTRGGTAVEGALIISTCPGGLQQDLSEQGRAFSEIFRRQYGRLPSGAAKVAFDAMTLVLAAREQAARLGGTRNAARQALRSASLRDGVCGTLTVDGSGLLQGEIEVLRVESGAAEIFEF